MQTERNFFEELKYQFSFGSTTVKLIFINVIVFIAIQLLSIVANVIAGIGGSFLHQLVDTIFTLKSTSFYWQPWTFFTSIFSHFSLLHLLFNMLFLYFSGTAFEQLFDKKRLIYTYIAGGVFGGILEVLANLMASPLLGYSAQIVGASGAVMAIFAAVAFHRPSIKVLVFGTVQISIIWIIAIFILADLIQLGWDDGTAHFAHLGGAILGMISINKLNSSSNFITLIIRFVEEIRNFFLRMFTKQAKMKVKRGNVNPVKNMSDEEYNETIQERQKKIDQILAKIAKSGYESLTKAEKEFLFKQSKK